MNFNKSIVLDSFNEETKSIVTFYPYHVAGTIETWHVMTQFAVDNSDALFANAPLLKPVF